MPIERGEPGITLVSGRVPLRLRLPLRAAVMAEVPLPDPDFFEDPSSPVPLWLHLTNEAERSESDANAVRCYQMVLEDAGEAVDQVRWVRNLVSHPKLDRDPAQLEFLRKRLSVQEVRYDPASPTQRELLRETRELARMRVEALLERVLPHPASP